MLAATVTLPRSKKGDMTISVGSSRQVQDGRQADSARAAATDVPVADGSGRFGADSALGYSMDRNSSGSGSNGSVLLRIKRKRGTDPITALRIEALVSEGLDPQQAEHTARQELASSSSPPDHALGTSPSEARAVKTKKHMKGSQGVFQLAETVSMDSFASIEKTQRLQDRIRRRIRERPSRSGRVSAISSRPSTPARDATRVEGVIGGKQAPLIKAVHAGDTRVEGKGSSTPKRPMRVIDAVIGTTTSAKVHRHDRQGGEKDVTFERPASKDVEMESLDHKFADLLGDFLREQDLEPPSDLTKAASRNDYKQPPSDTESDSDDTGEYVYDIYYRVRDSFYAPNAAGAAEAGLRPANVAGRERETSSGLPSDMNLRAGPPIAADVLPIATLVHPSERNFFMDDSEEMQAEIEQGSKLVAEELYDSDRPFDEGEDEDSNDEDFYKNDYPEDEVNEQDDDAEDAFGSMYHASGHFGWSGPRRRAQQSGLYDSDGSQERDSDEEY